MRQNTKRSLKYRGCVSELNSSPNIQQTELYDQLTKVQEMIHSKLSEAKKLRRLNYLCEHTNAITNQAQQSRCIQSQGLSSAQYKVIALPQQCKEYNENINYYDMFWKLFLINQNTAWKINKLYDNVEEIQLKAKQIQNLFKDRQELIKDSEAVGFEKVMKKRNKIATKEQQKTITKVLCPYEKCYKEYCSEISLNLHIKLKHNGGNKSERQMYAEKIWKCRQAKKPEPLVPIYFAAGFLEEYGMLTGRVDHATYEKEKNANKWVQFQVDRKSFIKVQHRNDDVNIEKTTNKVKNEN